MRNFIIGLALIVLQTPSFARDGDLEIRALAPNWSRSPASVKTNSSLLSSTETNELLKPPRLVQDPSQAVNREDSRWRLSKSQADRTYNLGTFCLAAGTKEICR